MSIGAVPSQVLKVGEATFNQMGQFLGNSLSETGETIAKDVVYHLMSYAKGRAERAGLWPLLQNWTASCVVHKNGNQKVDDRTYHVVWSCPEETEISLDGILLKDRKPFIDHGFNIEN